MMCRHLETADTGARGSSMKDRDFESEQNAITNKMQEYFDSHIEVNQK